jgi:peptidoglycan hydrolase-like protein with peptidoglycan-binding domain
MYLQRAMYAGLALLLAAGPAVYGSPAAATGTKSKPSASSGGKTHKTSKKGRKRDRGQMAPTPERITEIQQALAKDGSFGGAANGKWDDRTVEAVRNFQTTHHLTPTGKLDALTLQRLGLGSQTAGVAAPTTPPNSTSRLVSSSIQTAPTRQ